MEIEAAKRKLNNILNNVFEQIKSDNKEKLYEKPFIYQSISKYSVIDKDNNLIIFLTYLYRTYSTNNKIFKGQNNLRYDKKNVFDYRNDIYFEINPSEIIIDRFPIKTDYPVKLNSPWRAKITILLMKFYCIGIENKLIVQTDYEYEIYDYNTLNISLIETNGKLDLYSTVNNKIKDERTFNEENPFYDHHKIMKDNFIWYDKNKSVLKDGIITNLNYNDHHMNEYLLFTKNDVYCMKVVLDVIPRISKKINIKAYNSMNIDESNTKRIDYYKFCKGKTYKEDILDDSDQTGVWYEDKDFKSDKILIRTLPFFGGIRTSLKSPIVVEPYNEYYGSKKLLYVNYNIDTIIYKELWKKFIFSIIKSIPFENSYIGTDNTFKSLINELDQQKRNDLLLNLKDYSQRYMDHLNKYNDPNIMLAKTWNKIKLMTYQSFKITKYLIDNYFTVTNLENKYDGFDTTGTYVYNYNVNNNMFPKKPRKAIYYINDQRTLIGAIDSDENFLFEYFYILNPADFKSEKYHYEFDKDHVIELNEKFNEFTIVMESDSGLIHLDKPYNKIKSNYKIEFKITYSLNKDGFTNKKVKFKYGKNKEFEFDSTFKLFLVDRFPTIYNSPHLIYIKPLKIFNILPLYEKIEIKSNEIITKSTDRVYKATDYHVQRVLKNGIDETGYYLIQRNTETLLWHVTYIYIDLNTLTQFNYFSVRDFAENSWYEGDVEWYGSFSHKFKGPQKYSIYRKDGQDSASKMNKYVINSYTDNYEFRNGYLSMIGSCKSENYSYSKEIHFKILSLFKDLKNENDISKIKEITKKLLILQKQYNYFNFGGTNIDELDNLDLLIPTDIKYI